MNNQPAFNPPSRITVTTDDLKLIKDMQRGYDSRELIDLYGVKFVSTALSGSAAFPASATMRAEEVRMIDPLPWSGDGLPPVGTTVVLDDECFPVFDDYRAMIGVPVVVTAAFKSPTGVDMIACALPGGLCGCFRADMAHPIKTPAQIAAEEREAAAVELAGILSGHDQHITVLDIEMAKYLYDIGYRRTEKGDDK